MAQDSKNAFFIADAVISEAKNARDTVQGFLTANCDKWVYQLEQGANPEDGQPGFRHFQCRFKLKERIRRLQLVGLMQRSGLVVHPAAVRPTSKAAGNRPVWSYVMKEDTRVDGPWKDTDRDPMSLPQRLRLPLMEPHNWQMQVLALPFDDRKIHLIVNETGHAGKSTFGQAHAAMNPTDWLYIKVDLREPRTIVEAIMAKYAAGPEFRDFTVFINVPRGCAGQMTERECREFCNILEMVKDGHVSDRRYSYKEAFLGRTRVIVVSNEGVQHTDRFLSADRPVYYRITPSMNLVPVNVWVPQPVSRDQLDAELYVLPDFAGRQLQRYPSDEDLEDGYEVRWRERTPPSSPRDE